MASRVRRGAQIHGPMRLTLPVSVAFDLDKFQQALANVAQLMGSPGRACGADAGYLLARELVVDAASLEVREAAP
jgi:hypothetical protein